MKIVCASDTHEHSLYKWSWPPGDVLVLAGDITVKGDPSRLEKMARRFRKLANEIGYEYILFVPGNHDRIFAVNRILAVNIMATYGIDTMIDHEINIGGHNFYGTPWIELQPADYHKLNPEFLVFSRLDCREFYNRIPLAHVVITHQPPSGMLDLTSTGESVGSPQLASVINGKLGLASHPITFIYGHNHAGHGMIQHPGRRFINASLCDEKHQPVHEPIVIEI